ncbi:hypothetical protein [uncultured Azohydromonas sp.]|uniref:hypothetical protein n=1 Tax=uncultured Azohydromonas sp. TaxID=487342 RepID=UPI0026208F9F|nr:hypothetical protein [uncultured Azohydromonas sp.]
MGLGTGIETGMWAVQKVRKAIVHHDYSSIAMVILLRACRQVSPCVAQKQSACPLERPCEHKNSQDACGKPPIAIHRQQLARLRTRTVSFHKLGHDAAQKWSCSRTEMVSLAFTRMVMIGTRMVMMVLFGHKNSQFCSSKSLIRKEFLSVECWLAFKVFNRLASKA